MELVSNKKRKVNIVETLRTMPISDDIALDVPKEQVKSVRSTLYRLNSQGDMRFTTQKTKTGISVWREK